MGRWRENLLAVFACTLLLGKVHPHPNNWIDNRASSCLDHPLQPYGGHSPPTQDATIVFSVAGTAAGAKICPGTSYQLKISYSGTHRQALLTSDLGGLPVADGWTGLDGCQGKQLIDGLNTELIRTLRPPCISSGPLTLKITTAQAADGGYLWNTATFDVDATCKPAICSDADAPDPAAHQPAPGTTDGCRASTMGYACMLTSGRVNIHYSTDLSALPMNECTAALGTSRNNDSMFHFAVDSNAAGYVALGFAGTTGRMAPSDSVIGWVTPQGIASVEAYYISKEDVKPADANPGWTRNMAVSRGAAGTAVCFSRPATAYGARVASTIDPSQKLSMIWAVSEYSQLDKHTSMGGVDIDLISGTADVVDLHTRDLIMAHAALMTLAWALILPVGVLFSRHRWALKRRQLWHVDLWFQLHRGFQLLGVVFFVLGLIVAYAKLPEVHGNSSYNAHGALAGLIIALAALQVLAVFLRPKPDSPHRPNWNLLHHNVGRLALLVAWINIYIGIWLFHDLQGQSIALGLALVSVLLGLVLIAFAVMEALACQQTAGGLSRRSASLHAPHVRLNTSAPATLPMQHFPATHNSYGPNPASLPTRFQGGGSA